MQTATPTKELAPGLYWMVGIPHNHRRIDTKVTVLSRIPYEPDMYRVRHHLSGAVIPCSGSLLHKI